MNRVLSILIWIALIALWVHTFIAVGHLPDTIPIHFNFHNEPDNYGSKYTLWLLPIVATTIIGLFSLIPKYPKYINYPVAITEENRERQQRFAFALIGYLRLFLPLLFLYVLHTTVEYVHHGMMDFNLWLVLGAVFLPIGIYFYAAYKAR